MASALVAVREEIAAKSKSLHEIFEQAGDEIDLSKAEALKSLPDGAARAAEVKRRNDELTDLGRKRDELAEMDGIAQKARHEHEFSNLPANGARPVFPGAQPGADGKAAERKSIGQHFVESTEYKANIGQARPKYGVELGDVSVTAEMKTVLTTAAGFAPFSPRTNIIIPSAQRRPMVGDLIPQDDTQAAAIIYMEETTFTNAAASVAEGATKPEATLAWTQRTQPVEVIAVMLPVTRQQMDDVQQIRALIDNRLTLMLQLTEEVELLTGSGVSPHLQGFLTKSGVQTQAKGADPTPDAIYKAMTLVRFTGFADPTAVVMHPNDWQDVRLLKDTTGNYLWGSPADAGPERIWSVPVVVTPAETEGTALTGDFQLFSHISRRMGIQIDVSDSHSDWFAKNQLAIRAEERLSLEIYRAAAFALITGV
jgi:HK97 family phage major capsid protein